MERCTSEPTQRQLNYKYLADTPVAQWLDVLLKLNSEQERQKALFLVFDEEIEASAMRFPLGRNRTFAYFGAMLGSLPPISCFALFIFRNGYHPPPLLLVALMAATGVAASITGYHTGKIVGAASEKIEGKSFSKRILLFAMVGLLWGIVAGAAGGVFLFFIGAIFGALLGGAVGAVALPLFSIPYLAVKRGALIEMKHFLPIAIGVTLLISAYILGFLYR